MFRAMWFRCATVVVFNGFVTSLLAFQVLYWQPPIGRKFHQLTTFRFQRRPRPDFPTQLLTYADTTTTSLRADASLNPENWYSDTDPFIAVRAFANENVTDAAIKLSLDNNAITSMSILRLRSHLVPIQDESKYARFIDAVHDSSKRARKTVEEVLGGGAVYDESLLSRDCFDSFTPDAASVLPDTRIPMPRASDRRYKFTLVLGSSGSGKTMFALRQLPLLLYKERNDTNSSMNYFSVHFAAAEAFSKAESGNLTFRQAVTEVVEQIIQRKLNEKQILDAQHINLHLHIVLDEAGGSLYEPFFCQASHIETLVLDVQTNLRYNFTKGVHITVTGTGLDTTTASIPSGVEIIKFRMQPWTMANFEAILNKKLHPCPKLLSSAITNNPILELLITNARCAYFLLKCSDNCLELQPARVKDIVKSLVRSVADRYISQNGLSRLKTPQDQFIVARSVLRALEESTSKPDVPFFPRFGDVPETFIPVAASLVDVQVESSDGKLVLVHSANHYSLTVSPAIVLVLISLLSTEAQVMFDWDGFEFVAMLGELKRVVVNTRDVPTRLDKLVHLLQNPLPATRAKQSISLPMVENYTVILNGPRAEYADVIAPYRLVQTKFSVDDSKIIPLDIQTELNKMGLTKSPTHKLQQFLTNVFYTEIWGSHDVRPDSTVHTMVRSTKMPLYRNEWYPVNLIHGRRRVSEKFPMIKGEIKSQSPGYVIKVQHHDGSGNSSRTSKNGKPTARRVGSKPYTFHDFQEDLPVTAVFATNGAAFRLNLPANEEGEEKVLIIKPENVDWQGKLQNRWENDDSIVKGLLENVHIRFLFL